MPPTTDLFGSGTLQGGSTITEQYAKNYYANIGASRTVTTKIKEIFVAIKLAHSRSKPWILTNYLNTVPFGNNIYGVWAAAEDYFGINLAKQGATLTTAQAAMLGAMPNVPASSTPDPTAGVATPSLVQRWQYVLTNMVRDGAITPGNGQLSCARVRAAAGRESLQQVDPAQRVGLRQRLDRYDRLPDADGPAGAREHLPLQPGEDPDRRTADHHHLQPVA